MTRRLKAMLGLTLGVALLMPLVPASAGGYNWDGKYLTRCRPVAWRQPADWADPQPYTVRRRFTQYPDRVMLLSRGDHFNMGAPGRRISGEKNISRHWRTEIEAKATRTNPWGLVKKYVGPTRNENRLFNGIWVEYWCKGKRIPGN